MNARTMKLRMIGACIMVIAGVLTLHVLASALNYKFDKPPVPLRKELSSIPRMLGTAYRAGPLDDPMPADQVQALGTNQYLLRNYQDQVRGGKLTLNVNYYPTGTGSVHVPEICWTESGRRRYIAGDREFVIPNVRLADGTTIDLPIRMLAFEPLAQDLREHPEWAAEIEKHLTCVAYTFFVNGEYVGKREQVMQKFWKAAYPFAIHAKIEVKLAERTSPEQARPILEAFFKEVMPEVSACFPDTRELLAGPAGQTQGSATSTQTPTTGRDAMPAASAPAAHTK